ncbi:hypothetical protein SOM26_15075 [Sphingomonas sp. CFBP8993]|uniref:hypothetical protein n=1 Tax=Sphingomonas sp. CFBP8993 TaxID=3096526 RepID=UPI002A6A6AEB|nr:hypothetical protein [Sphingomonas sp. CFBP8993]MDY0960016.1 hypothetical protein [Sphingomonas sp. CFBP8993]
MDEDVYLIIALFLQAADSLSLPGDVWADLSYSASLAGVSETIEILRTEGRGDASGVALRLVSRRHGEAPRIQWANSQTCPVAADAVRNLRSIPMPDPVLPDDRGEIILDGVGYRVRFQARYGLELGFPMELRSNTGTPLAAWVSRTFKMLKPCWSTVRYAL